MSESKHPFLVGYDYGMGGLWGVINARSVAEITAKYPELSIVQRRPKWMTIERYGDLLEREQHDIDEPQPWGILVAVLADRQKRSR
jgi:hypothetical protein